MSSVELHFTVSRLKLDTRCQAVELHFTVSRLKLHTRCQAVKLHFTVSSEDTVSSLDFTVSSLKLHVSKFTTSRCQVFKHFTCQVSVKFTQTSRYHKFKLHGVKSRNFTAVSKFSRDSSLELHFTVSSVSLKLHGVQCQVSRCQVSSLKLHCPVSRCQVSVKFTGVKCQVSNFTVKCHVSSSEVHFTVSSVSQTSRLHVSSSEVSTLDTVKSSVK